MDVVTVTLTRKQTEGQMSNAAFARKLRISRPTWIGLKKGYVKPTVAVLQKAYQAYPDSLPTIISYLTTPEDAEKKTKGDK